MTRVLAAAVFAPALLALVVRGGEPLRLGCGILGLLMLYEAIALTLPRSARSLRLAAAGAGLCILAHGLGLAPATATQALGGACVGLVLLAALAQPLPPQQLVPQAGAALLAATYGCSFVPLLWQLRELPELGLGLALMALFCTWSADTGAYFAGRAWGRRKLYPRISPGKTLEGALGGIGAAMAMAWALRAGLGLALSVGEALTLGVVAATLGTLGDLCESLLKRAAGVKDSSRMIPGHGGLLDRFDGVLFALWGVRAYAAYLFT